MITSADILHIMPNAVKRVGAFVAPLNAAMLEFEIDNVLREAAFLAQIAHESSELRYLEEIASGAAYEGREDLGNDEPGDGVRFKGRGVLQITGRSNYAACGHALDLDLLEHPERLVEPNNACRAAGWFWHEHGLNELADRGDFLAITKRINGGIKGWAQRLNYYRKAQDVLKQTSIRGK